MSAPIEPRFSTIDTQTILHLKSQNPTMDDATYQYLHERWMRFSNDERAIEKEMFTANGFLPEFHKRRKDYVLKLRQQLRNLLPQPPPPLQHHITVWGTTPESVKVSYQKLDPTDEETDEKEKE